MTQQVLRSPDGRDEWIATGDDEIAYLKSQGFTVPSANRRVPETNDPGFVGNQLSRASATTQSSESNSGATVDLTQLDDAELLKEYQRRQSEKARAREESAARRAAEQSEEDSAEETEDDEDEDDDDSESDEGPAKQESKASASTPAEKPKEAPRQQPRQRPQQPATQSH